MPKETMSPGERWRAVLTRRVPDRVPMDYWGTPETTRRLMQHLRCGDEQELMARLHIDRPLWVGPRYVGPRIAKDADEFGRRYRDIDYGAGTYRECVHHPLAGFETLGELKRGYRWPSADWYDHSTIASQIAGRDDRPIHGGGWEPFLEYKDLRGDEQAFVDLAEKPDIVHWCLDRILELAYESTLRIFEAIPGKVLLSYVSDDLGGQESLMLSPAHICEFLLPRMKRMTSLVHDAGAFVFHHDDGAIRPVIPMMIEAGIDILDPIQWRCRGMDREALKRDFGDRVVFHGGVDSQQTLSFGNAEEVRQEVEENLRILGEGGGYILGPCNHIQATVPPGNVVAMYEAGYSLGWT